MSSLRAPSLKRERSTSTMPDSVSTPSEGPSAAQLFEDNSVKVESPTVKENLEGGVADMKMEDNDTTENSTTPQLGTTDEKPSSSSAVQDNRKSTTPPVGSKLKVKKEKPGPQLIGELPRAEESALSTFTEIRENHYQYGTLGRSREALESMTCDCQYEHGVDDPDSACGLDSDCINRLTQVECLPDDCRCRGYCQNQRFQQKQYAPIEIVQTEKKGFGLRAAADLRKDTFIYEYVGDVVSQPSFLKRMRQYAEEGIRHFYFMMLQKDEYIDATKRGGIGRFANHSCNPNCYVAKWTIGDRVRMGIFAHRSILKNEELTFNYNVDRYGHEAQPCYCGEAKCVGFIGGKTQTDLAAMDDLYLDALGISDEVEQLGLKGSKKKKSKKLDEDFIPDLKPLIEKDVPKVVQAMRQTQSRKVLFKLLTRIKITEDQPALRQIMRLRGFSVMTNIMEDYANDIDLLCLAMECMSTWPLIQRNKVEDSKVSIPVRVCSESEDEKLAALAKKLLEQWENLEYAYRIPKRMKADGEEDEQPYVTSVQLYESDLDARPSKRYRKSPSPPPDFSIKPLGFSASAPRHSIPDTRRVQELEEQKRQAEAMMAKKQKQDIAAIIAAAAAAAEAVTSTPPPVEPPVPSNEEVREKKKSSRAKRQSREEKESNKEKRLLKLVGAIVVKCMSKYRDQMDHDLFKKHAKELTYIIAEKEKKSSSYRENRLETLSDEKVAKVKKFAKEYIAKVLRKLEKAGQRRKPSLDTPDSALGVSTSTASQDLDLDLMDEEHTASMEDAMDIDADDDHESGTPLPESPEDPKVDQSDHDNTCASPIATMVADPRLRHRNEESGWDPNQGKGNTPKSEQPAVVSVGS